MAISVVDRKMLWGRAGNRCAFPDCRVELTAPTQGAGGGVVVGEEAHIVAREADGPRGESDLPPKERDTYSNLILLCPTHHTIIDKAADDYSVAMVRDMKQSHEEWVRSSLAGFDAGRQRDEEVYGGYVDEWEQRVELDNWEAWTSGLLSHGQPRILVARLDALEETARWIFRRVWPGTIPSLEGAFELFRRIAQDLVNNMRNVSRTQGPSEKEMLVVEKGWKTLEERGIWDEERFKRAAERFDRDVDAVMNLTAELTRAANLLCDEVRRHLVAGYRLDQGHVTISGGPYEGLSWKTWRPQYAPDTDPSSIYEDVESLLADRASRDVYFGGVVG